MILGGGIDGGEECPRDDWVSNGLRGSGEDSRLTRSEEWAHEDARLHTGGRKRPNEGRRPAVN